jgi:(p)ppGpp synthase/HD superfamily hydrolase
MGLTDALKKKWAEIIGGSTKSAIDVLDQTLRSMQDEIEQNPVREVGPKNSNTMTREELDRRIQNRMHESKAVRAGVELVKKARSFAIQAHGDQKYGDKPYSVHLDAVELVLIEFNQITSFIRAAAWLHDVLEDTTTTYMELEEAFPGYVPLLVQAVTSEPGRNRKERNIKTYPKIEARPDAVVLKLADRITNVRNCIESRNKDLYSMYHKEYPGFRLALKNDNPDAKEMWHYLDILMEFDEEDADV